MVETVGGIDELTGEKARAAQRSLDNLIAITLEQSIQFPVVRQQGDFPKFEPTIAYYRLAAEAEALRLRNPRLPITLPYIQL